MDEQDFCFLSLAETSDLLRSRKLSPVDLVRAVLRRIDSLEHTIGAFVTVLPDSALEAARAAERDISQGKQIGPLHGIPISLKDLIYLKGVRNTAGSKTMAEFVPDHNATVTERLQAAGAILVGKVQLDELAMGPTTVYHFGVTRNPWDPNRLTWGSSSGSAAAVSAFFCHASIGTDTGGSIRAPASACGVVGFKPTYGRVSRYGVVPLSWSLDCVGPLARTVTDCALVMNAIAGFDPKDPGSFDAPVSDYAKGLSPDIQGLRVGLPTHFFFEGLDAEYAISVQQAIQVLEAAGARLHDISFPSIEHAQTARSLIILAESASLHKELIRRHASMLGPNVRTRLEVGSTILAADYLKAQRVRSAFQREYARAMKDLDVIVTPTSPAPPPRFDEAPALWSADPQVDRKGADRFRWPFNLVGAPAISVPCGFTSSGLPVGLQIAGNPLEDQMVLKVAYAYEQHTEWQKRRPPVG